MSKEMNYCIDCIHCDEWMNCEYGNRRIEDVPCIAFEKGKKSPWHTGTPTEEGWYLLKLVDEYGRITYYANYLRKGKKGMEWKYAFFGHVIIKWQSIEDEPEVMMG